MPLPRHVVPICLAVAALAAVVTLAGGQPRAAEPPAAPANDLDLRYTVVVPRANYQALVISPRAGVDGNPRTTLGEPLPFIIRSRDAAGRVSDFPFFVRVGDLHTVSFPTGWSPSTESALFAPDGAIFAAWGVTAGREGAGGQIIRFEPLERDPQRDARDRDRARAFDEFLREVERTR